MNDNGMTRQLMTGLPGTAELLLVRHGESQGNVAATLAHQSGAHVINVPARDADVELAGTGRGQAPALGGLLAGFPEDGRAAVWSSPYLRARQTAELARDVPELAEKYGAVVSCQGVIARRVATGGGAGRRADSAAPTRPGVSRSSRRAPAGLP